MRADGITDVIIQPTHVINGIENDLMKEHAPLFSVTLFAPSCLGLHF